MPADTSTAILQLLLQGTGNNDNTWGANLNSDVIQLIEDAIAGISTIATTGGTTTLTDDEARAAFINVTGTLASNATIVVPNRTKSWQVRNATSGSFSLFVKTSSGTAVQVPQGTTERVTCFGSNVVERENKNLVGTFVDSADASAAPAGSLECAGTSLLRADYPDLFAKLSTSWGAGSVPGSTFALPNLQDTGRFRRCYVPIAVPVGTSQTNALKSHDHTAYASSSTSIAASGTLSMSGTSGGSDRSLDHTHGYTAPNAAAIYYQGTAYDPVVKGSGGANTGTSSGGSLDHLHSLSVAGANHAHSATTTTTVTITATGSTETRPEAIVVRTCIWY